MKEPHIYVQSEYFDTSASERVPAMITTDGGTQFVFFNEKITTFR